MNKRIKREWIKALRSGEYEQTRRRLCDDTGFCCLGVLWDITQDGYWYYIDVVGWRASKYGDAGAYGKIAKILGRPYVKNYCASMNDNGKTFDQIANWIEANL